MQGPAAEIPYRDRAAERAIVASLGLTPGRFGLLRTDPVSDEPQPSLAPQVRLSGLDTMRFSTEVLPRLADHPDVTVEITGDPADYREAGDSLSISVSTGEVPDDPDWFDLGITITVAGREVPFADVFVALSRRESYLLLADGAYFSLQKPELQALARLIEESRALHDAPGDGLKISRFQAGFWAELTELGVVSRQARRWQQQVSGLLSAEARAAPELPATLHAELRPYQQEALVRATAIAPQPIASPRPGTSACGRQRSVAGPLPSRSGQLLLPFLALLGFLGLLALLGHAQAGAVAAPPESDDRPAGPAARGEGQGPALRSARRERFAGSGQEGRP